MNSPANHRPAWPIDLLLEGLLGQNIRVGAESFSPAVNNGHLPRLFVGPRQLVLPDNTSAAGLPLYFEGRLARFVREIGVVHVELGSPAASTESVEGFTYFRGSTAVILRGPALVKLAFPFHVEKLPGEAENYWEDLRMPHAQFKLPL